MSTIAIEIKRNLSIATLKHPLWLEQKRSCINLHFTVNYRQTFVTQTLVECMFREDTQRRWFLIRGSHSGKKITEKNKSTQYILSTNNVNNCSISFLILAESEHIFWNCPCIWQPPENPNDFWSTERIAVYLVSIEQGLLAESDSSKAAGWLSWPFMHRKPDFSVIRSRKMITKIAFFPNYSGLGIQNRQICPLSIALA